MTDEQIEKLIRPPFVLREDTVILSPPLGSVDAYMKYLEDHREDYRRLFYGDDA